MTLIAVLLAMCIPEMWGWATLYWNGDFTGENWDKETYVINYALGGGGDGQAHRFLPIYTTSGTKRWKLYCNGENKYALAPLSDAYSMSTNGAKYQVKGTNPSYSFSTTVTAGIVAVHTHQQMTQDDKTGDVNGTNGEPAVWLERPTIYIWHNWNNSTTNWGDNGGSGQKAMTDNNDGTYTYDDKYCGGGEGTNVGIEGSVDIKKYFAPANTIVVGSPVAGNKCRFTWNPGGNDDPYVGYDGNASHRGSLTITKLCTITYNGNGKTGGSVPGDQADILYNTATNLRTNSGNLVKTDYVFTGWNTQDDGNGTHYDAGASFTPTPTGTTVTLYAEWQPAWNIKGSMDSWADYHAMEYVSANTYSATINLTVGSHTFKVVKRVDTDGDHDVWYGKASTTFARDTRTAAKGLAANTASTDLTINADVAGEYTFTYVYDESASNMKVYVKYPCFTDLAGGTIFALTMGSGTGSQVRPPRASDASHPGLLDLISYGSIANGLVYAGNKATGSDKGGITSSGEIYLDGDDAFIKIQLDCPLETGDKITVSTNNDVYVTTSSTRASTYTISKSATYVCPVAFNAASEIYLWKNSSNAKVTKITIERCQTPSAPSAFSTSNVMATTATFSITDAADAESYDLYYASGSPSAPTSGTTATENVTTKTPTITGLSASTTYKIWVRSVCDASHKSSWVALSGYSFKTADFEITDAGKNGSGTPKWSDKSNGDAIVNTDIDGIISGGTVVYSGTGTLVGNDTHGIIFDNDNDELTITVTGMVLPAGAVITIVQHGNSSTSKATGFKISGNSMSPETCSNGSTAYKEMTQTYTVVADDGVAGKNNFKIKWTGTNQVYLKSMKVTGCEEASCTTPTASWATAPANGYVGGNRNATLTTNYATGVVYTSSNTDVATVSGDGTTTCTITYKAAGSARITATVTGDGSTICAGPATCYTDITVSKNTPTDYTISGGGTLCSGGDADITLSGSQSGISYQLYNGASTVGDAVSGTGSALTWADVATAGTYTVKAVANDAYNAATMSGSATITFYDDISIGTQPTASVNAIVSSAASLSGLALSSGSFNNAAYQWQTCDKDDASGTNTDITSGSAYANYNTATLSFTPSSAGTYYFRCVVSDDCGNEEASNVVTVTAKNQPAQYTVSGTASICSGSNTNITLSNSETGVSYQLYKDGVADGDPEDGSTGDAIVWTVSAAGTYTIKAAESSTYWERAMSGSAKVSFKTATSISTQPATAVDATVSEDFTLGSALVAAGDGTLQYQWFSYSNAAGDADETSVRSASTTKTFTTSKAVAGTYYYRVKVIGGCGTVASNVITVTVSACSPQTLVKTVITGYSDSKFQKTTTGTKAGTPIIDLTSKSPVEVDLDEDENNEKGYKMDDKKKFYVQLSGTTLKAGDIIRVGITKANDNYSDPATSSKNVLIICAWDGSSMQDSIGKITDVSGAGIYSYTVKASDLTRCEGANDTIHYVGLARNRWAQNPFMHSIEIVRPCAAPSCSTPAAPTAFAATEETSSSVTLSITDAANAASYDIYYSKSSTTPTSGTAASTNVSSKTPTIGGLESATTYYAWVRSVCDETHKSDWVVLTGSTFETDEALSCTELNYVWQTGSSKTPKGVSNTYADGDTATIINSNVATTHITISGTNYEQKKGSKGSLNIAKATDNYFLLTAASGYKIDSVYFYGKLEDGACRMSTDGSAWTTTLGDGSSTGEKVYAIGVGTQYFGLKNNDEDSPAGIWIRTMMVKVCPDAITYTVTYNANGHGTAPSPTAGVTPGATISEPSEPSAGCWTFGGWYKERACTNAWNFGEDEVTGNITLYAKWTSNAARVKSMNYGETNYTVTEGTADALTVTPVSTTGVTYKWLTNTTDDASSASVVEGAETASYSPSIAAVGTKYYWAVLVHACGNDTTSGIRIHVAAAKTDPTIVWGDVDATPTYGGGGYTLTGTINAGDVSTPTLTTDMISADGGIVITNKSVTDAGKTFSLTFDVTAAFDTTQANLTNIHFSLPSNATYNDSVFSTNLSYEKCSGGGGADPIVWNFNSMSSGASFSTSNPGTEGNKNAIAATTGTAILYYFAGSGDDIKAPAKGKQVVFYMNGTSGSASIGGSTKYSNRCFYLDITSNGTLTITNSEDANGAPSYQITDGTRPGTSGYTAKSAKGTGSDAYVYEIPVTTYNASTANRIWVVYTSSKPYINNITWTPAGSGVADAATTTALQWKSGQAPSDISGWDGTASKLVKEQSDDNFTCVAEQTSTTNSVGAITYVSSDVTVATVNATTGEVDIVAGAAGGEATITATMARSGCFKAATLSYTISVSELVCDIEPGTLSASATSKCKTADVTLTLSDYTTAGTALSWYKSGTAEPLTDGSTYDIEGATMTTAEAGTYYVKVTLSESGCSLTSNNVTITNKSGAASVSKLVNQWYIKKGRTTPDVALWQLGEGSSYVANSAKADGVDLDDQLGGCTVIARDDGIIYLSGSDPTGIAAAGNVSLTVDVQDECGNTTTSEAITIHKQVATDKHELAFVTIGTNYSKKEFTEDAWTDGIKAGNSTSLALYQLLKDTFKIQATNIYASDDEQKIREYYSQYDLICITDYPNTGTKGKNSKSYVDAIGTLIDIRPVLTMEAWVSGLDNWRNKGVVGTRTTPSARQYNMFLQCKDHEIFEGVRIDQLGYGDDALFKVNMVDSTESRYVELDAVGKDNHATDTAALQGFTTGEMDLLAIGLIDNGSGTNLQVGAERQEVMKARMMVLGINSYAMERLSDDGLRVVLNALQYLTKKRAEDISDCSSYFIGGADGHEDEWGWAANWRSGMIPTSNQEARILQPVVVSDTRKIASVKIVADGTFQDAEARGSLTIAPTGALIVEDKVQRSIAPNVMSGSPTQSGDIIIETDPDDGQGALMLNNDDERTQATVKLYSKGCNNGSYQFQYFASPFNSISSWAFDAYIYNHSETLNPEWTQLRYGEDVEAFQGLALTADGAAKEYEIAGTLASTQPHVYELSYTSSKANNKKGTNVVGNSWSAPIQITRIDDSDFDSPSNFEGVIYIYNAGRDVLVDGKVYASNGNNEPGQWQSIPIETAKTEEWAHKRQIPAFQAFQMKVNAATEFTLNYNKHVRQEASVGDNNYNEPLHAPRRSMRSEAVKVLRLCVEDEQVGKSYIYLCEGDQFTEERDRGWEAQQTIGSGKYGKLYAIDQARDYMMSIARESLEGTPVGFISGLSTEYTITFNETEGTYYLNDMETQQSTLIQEGESYTFTTTKGNHPNRFIISAIPFDKPGIATGVTDLDAEAPKVQKVIYNDKLFIIRGGKVYSAEGQLVK